MARISYQEAAIPEPWQILGLRLKPLCLGHCLHLARFNNAFVSLQTTDATLTDLVVATLICSMSYEDFLEFLEGDWKTEMRAWGEKVGDFDLAEKVALMNRYMLDGSRQPAIIFEGPTRESGSHWCQTLKVALLGIGYEKSQALNMPLTEAFADFYRDAEVKGVVTIADPELAMLLDGEGDQPEAGPNIPEASSTNIQAPANETEAGHG